MIFRVNDIGDKVRRMSAIEPISDFPSLVEIQDEGICRFLTPLSLEFSAVREYDHIRVDGQVDLDVNLVCSRCLAGFDTHVRSSFTIFYTKASAAVQLDEEVELGEKELVSAAYEGDEIDVSGEAAEHVLMELPLKPLCREECQGLCPQCGIDLNAGSCDCREQKGSLAFSALKNLKLDR